MLVKFMFLLFALNAIAVNADELITQDLISQLNSTQTSDIYPVANGSRNASCYDTMVVLRRGIFNNNQGTVNHLYNLTTSGRSSCNDQLAVVKQQADNVKTKRGSFVNKGSVKTVHNKKRGSFSNEAGGQVDTVYNRRSVEKRGNFYNTGLVNTVHNGDEPAPAPAPVPQSNSEVHNFYNEGDVTNVNNKKKRNILVIGDTYHNNGTSVKTVYNIKRNVSIGQLTKRGEFRNLQGGHVGTVYNRRNVEKRGNFINNGRVSTVHNGQSKPAPPPAPAPAPEPAPAPVAPKSDSNFYNKDGARVVKVLNKRGVFNNEAGGQVETVYNRRDIEIVKRGEFSNRGHVGVVHNGKRNTVPVAKRIVKPACDSQFGCRPNYSGIMY